LGLMADLLGGGFLGVNALVLLTAYASTLALRPWLVGASFAIVWWGFAILSAGALLFTCMLTRFLARSADPGRRRAAVPLNEPPLLGRGPRRYFARRFRDGVRRRRLSVAGDIV